ncbi:hypothetical protein M409DRAFT_51806 [Zasmidium cellare ATCC 36951]|uniref:Mid2 domain-containing protein n=1 Tax=Zasmidium cellare ATCC 36951 TaxID=1080233 RepID=A0A6A6CS99_ZASCE|nr:uncharacterized protein M409DRAFT_51806 [Zasmidium cellare ATCC 36951]KAF2170034.1 hypothetical protein M409DRAFT_51806 [Zasmidium cellare ATCC 36951]
MPTLSAGVMFHRHDPRKEKSTRRYRRAQSGGRLPIYNSRPKIWGPAAAANTATGSCMRSARRIPILDRESCKPAWTGRHGKRDWNQAFVCPHQNRLFIHFVEAEGTTLPATCGVGGRPFARMMLLLLYSRVPSISPPAIREEMSLVRRVFLSALLAGLGTRSAAIPARFSNITHVSATHHTSAATPAYSEITNAANSLLLHNVGQPPETIPAFNPIATNLENCHQSRTEAVDHNVNPTATGASASQSSTTIHASNLATGWNASEQLGTATHGRPLHLSTLPKNGHASASHTRVGLAAILLEPATVTSVHVPTPQTTPGGSEQNVDPSSLSSATSKQSHHTTPGPLSQTAVSDGRRQMDNDNDDTNNAITTANTRPTSIMVNDMDSSDGVGKLVSAVGDVATLSGADAKVLTQAPTASADATNALDVLLSALPSSVAESLESQFSATATEVSTTRPSSRPTTRPTTRTRPVSTTSTSASSIPTSSSSTITSSSTTFTISTRSTSNTISSTSSSPSSTSTNAPPTDSNSSRLENNAVAGIATGVTAGAVLIILAVVFFLRRRQQGKPFFGPRASQRSKTSGRAYPEIAWLYDPAPTPPNEPSSSHHQGEESASSLLPQVREPEMAAMAAAPLGSNPYRSPELRPAAGPESPLLPPNMPAARDESPGGSPSGSPRSSSQSPRRSARSSVNSSAGDGRRPLHAIFEEGHAQ